MMMLILKAFEYEHHYVIFRSCSSLSALVTAFSCAYIPVLIALNCTVRSFCLESFSGDFEYLGSTSFSLHSTAITTSGSAASHARRNSKLNDEEKSHECLNTSARGRWCCSNYLAEDRRFDLSSRKSLVDKK